MENKFDTQFLIEGHDLDEDAIHDGILNSAKGDCLLVVGDEDVVKVHYHTDTPWKVFGVRRRPRRIEHHHRRKHGAPSKRVARVNWQGARLTA